MKTLLQPGDKIKIRKDIKDKNKYGPPVLNKVTNDYHTGKISSVQVSSILKINRSIFFQKI